MKMPRFVASMMMLHTLLAADVNAKELVYTRAFADDDYGIYHVAVLHALLNATKEYGDVTLVPYPQPITQSRQMLSLLKGEADIMWSVTNQAREQKLIPIKLPLLKVFSGFKVLVINPSRREELTKSADSRTLKSLTMVQGSDWPDIDVLTANGYSV